MGYPHGYRRIWHWWSRKSRWLSSIKWPMAFTANCCISRFAFQRPLRSPPTPSPLVKLGTSSEVSTHLPLLRWEKYLPVLSFQKTSIGRLDLHGCKSLDGDVLLGCYLGVIGVSRMICLQIGWFSTKYDQHTHLVCFWGSWYCTLVGSSFKAERSPADSRSSPQVCPMAQVCHQERLWLSWTCCSALGAIKHGQLVNHIGNPRSKWRFF